MALTLRETLFSLSVGCVVGACLWNYGNGRVDELVSRVLQEQGVVVTSLSSDTMTCLVNGHSYGRRFEGKTDAGQEVAGTVCATPAFIMPESVLLVLDADDDADSDSDVCTAA